MTTWRKFNGENDIDVTFRMTPSVFFPLLSFSPRIQHSEANTRLISNKIYCFDSPNGWQCLLWRLSYILSHSNIKSKHFSRFQFKCLREWFGLRVVIRRWMWYGEQIIGKVSKRPHAAREMVLKVSIFHYVDNMFAAASINLVCWHSGGYEIQILPVRSPYY